VSIFFRLCPSMLRVGVVGATAVRALQGVLLQAMLVASLPLLAINAVLIVLTLPASAQPATLSQDADATFAMYAIVVLYITITAVTLFFGNAIFFHDLATGQEPTLPAVCGAFRRMYDAVAVAFLFLAVVSLGSILLLVPGLMLAAGLGMSYFVMIDRPTLTPRQALEASWALVSDADAIWAVLFMELLWPALYFAGGAVLWVVLGALLGQWGRLMATFLQRSLWLIFLLTCSWACRAFLYVELAFPTGVPNRTLRHKAAVD